MLLEAALDPSLRVREGRNLSLDGLRGCAAFLVMVYHFTAVIFPAALTGNPAVAHGGWEVALYGSPFWFLLDGEFDVAVFFVLSGYVLTRDAFLSGETAVIRRRAVGRLPRLALPAGVSTLAVFVLLHLGAYRLQAAQAASGADSLFDSHRVFAFPRDLGSLLDNLFWRTWFAPADVTRMYNLVLWTMPAELWGSFIVFAASLILGWARWRTGVLAVLAVVLWQAVPGNGVALGVFVGGAALASARRRWLPNAAWLAVGAAGLVLGAYNGGPLFQWLGLPGWIDTPLRAAGALLLVAAVLHVPLLQRVFEWRPFLWLGRISFARYLVHQPIIYSLGAAVFLSGAGRLGYQAAAASSFAVVLAASLAVALAAERWIDRPATRLARRFADAVLRDAGAGRDQTGRSASRMET